MEWTGGIIRRSWAAGTSRCVQTPPAYILDAEGDFLLENAHPMAAFFTDRGVENVCKICGDKNTGRVFRLEIRKPRAAGQ